MMTSRGEMSKPVVMRKTAPLLRWGWRGEIVVVDQMYPENRSVNFRSPVGVRKMNSIFPPTLPSPRTSSVHHPAKPSRDDTAS